MVETAAEKEKKNLTRKAYGAATSRLRDEHRAHFNTLMVEEAKKLGVDWSPRPSSEEKMRADLRKMLAENPDLKGYVQTLLT